MNPNPEVYVRFRAQQIAYTSLTADDWVMAEAAADADAAVAVLERPEPADPEVVMDPPYWAVIHPSGSVSFIHGKPDDRDLQRAVGGWLEEVRGCVGYTALCNEDGKRDRLPFNIPASRFVGMAHDTLVGPVVIMGPADEEGETTPLPADVRMRLVREVAES